MVEKHGPTGATPPWTAEDEERLRRLILAGKNVAIVSKELMRTEAAVSGGAYKLGMFFGKARSKRGRGSGRGDPRDGGSGMTMQIHPSNDGTWRAKR